MTFSCTYNQSIGMCYYSKDYDQIFSQMSPCTHHVKPKGFRRHGVKKFLFESADFTKAIDRQSDVVRHRGNRAVSESEYEIPTSSGNDSESDSDEGSEDRESEAAATADHDSSDDRRDDASAHCADEVIDVDQASGRTSPIVEEPPSSEEDISKDTHFPRSSNPSVVAVSRTTIDVIGIHYSNGTQDITQCVGPTSVRTTDDCDIANKLAKKERKKMERKKNKWSKISRSAILPPQSSMGSSSQPGPHNAVQAFHRPRNTVPVFNPMTLPRDFGTQWTLPNMRFWNPNLMSPWTLQYQQQKQMNQQAKIRWRDKCAIPLGTRHGHPYFMLSISGIYF
ncbi:unnamed protein product [Allacma fusca]|uniref:Uncharacterized protein n=1 Tax=Allacma fusca TaxID=39272 RepID=A0A8J2JJE0_9HEXA|nr:unnamed protein product [Allacma fusca]